MILPYSKYKWRVFFFFFTCINNKKSGGGFCQTEDAERSWEGCFDVLALNTCVKKNALSEVTEQLFFSYFPIGYTVWAHNLIAIARLRGSDLKVLEVTEESIDFDQGELADQDVDPVHNLIEQVSLGLGRPWHAVMDIELLSVFTEPTRHFYREMQSFSEGI